MLIKHMSMANYLLERDNKLEKIDRDKKDRAKLVFYFKDSHYLDYCLSLYQDFKRTQRGLQDDENQ